MKTARHITHIVLAFTFLLAMAGAAPSEAGEVSLSVGVGFVVGGASFHVAYSPGGRGYAPYYYRVESPLRHSGYSCDAHCYTRAGYYYHAPYCPLVHRHFSVHHYQGPYYGRSRHYASRHYDYGHHGYGHKSYGRHGYGPQRQDRYYNRGRNGRDYRSDRRGTSHHGYGGRGHGGSYRGGSHSPGSARRTRP